MKEKLIKLIEVACKTRMIPTYFTINETSNINNISFNKFNSNGGERKGQKLNGRSVNWDWIKFNKHGLDVSNLCPAISVVNIVVHFDESPQITIDPVKETKEEIITIMGKPTWFSERKYEFDVDRYSVKNYLMKCGSFEFDLTIEEVDELVEKINQGIKDREMGVLRERFKKFGV